MSKDDNDLDDSSSFLPVTESSVGNFEDLKPTKMSIGLQLFDSFSKKSMIFQNSVIHIFLHADERSRRDSRRKNRLRTTKKEDFL